MNNLDGLSETLVELKKEFENEIALLDPDKLGRGKYLKAKSELKSQSKYRLLGMSRSGASKELIVELESSLNMAIPKQLADFLTVSNGFDGNNFLIHNCAGILAARENQKVMIEIDGVFSSSYLNMLEFARDTKMPIGIWMNPGSERDGQVFLHDVVDRRVFWVAESMYSFFIKVRECLAKGQQPSFVSVVERCGSMSNGQNDGCWASDDFFRYF